MNGYLTKTARQKLARQAAVKAHGKTASNYQVGEAGKIIDRIVTANPTDFIEFHDRYCTPKHEAIVTATATELTSQLSLF